MKKNQILTLTAALTCILILIAAGTYFAIDSSSEMDGMMDGDSTNSNSLIISIILIAAAIIVSIGVTIYFVYPKKEESDKKTKSPIDKIVQLQGTNGIEVDKLNKIQIQKIKGRLSTGSEKLDKLLYGGIPPNIAVALTTPASEEGNELIKKFIETGAKNNEITFYVTIDPGFARDIARKFPLNFYLFAINPQTNRLTKQYPNMFTLKGIENLTEINISLTKSFRKLDPTRKAPRRICLNIISDILLEHGAVKARKWVSELIAVLNSEGFTILGVINPQMHTSEDLHAILGLFEGEINIHERETVKELKRFLKIKRMSNKKYLKNEIILTKD